MDIRTKQLTGQDNELVDQLLDCFSDAFQEPETYQRSRPDSDYTRSLLMDERVIVLVAIHESAVVGGLIAYELRKFEQERSELYIYDLAVAQPYRRQGIATQLIQRLQPVAQQRGAWVIYVQADLEDQPAVNLYSGLGSPEEVLHFDIPVVCRSDRNNH